MPSPSGRSYGMTNRNSFGSPDTKPLSFDTTCTTYIQTDRQSNRASSRHVVMNNNFFPQTSIPRYTPIASFIYNNISLSSITVNFQSYMLNRKLYCNYIMVVDSHSEEYERVIDYPNFLTLVLTYSMFIKNTPNQFFHR